MIVTIALFFLAISAAFAMIAHKIWEIRSGRYAQGSYEEADWTELSVESIRERLLELVKFGAHHTALVALKVWIIVSNWVKRTDKKIKDRLIRFMHRNGHYPKTGGTPSNFMQQMRGNKEAPKQAESEAAAPVAETEEK